MDWKIRHEDWRKDEKEFTTGDTVETHDDDACDAET